ncbi:putative tyrosinase-like protein tyr-3 [Lingula anatina]|uniref:Tyrosinase-like protein tyr-3 n=1 Tax=Lingula anatina TaxID=7574 RepID=A0A1S3HAX8_LINAN|nr:putative tyrosinase-like protein tyr-3 [Lingula anatina]|eukprot:XP_013382611.1 putative tyrosinase-like protein tyr-3 [Lingula anatina]
MMSLWVCVALLGVLGSATGHAGHECPEIHNANGRLTKEDIDMCCTKLNYWKRECAKPPKVNFPPEVVKYWESLETAVTHEEKEENASKHNRTKRQTATGRRDDTTINPPLYWQSRPIPPRPLPRKEYRLLSPAEKWRFHRALHAMKVTMVPNTEFSEYDIFTAYHQATEAPGAHFGPAFLPWHREFIKRFETAMQRHEPGVTLPYWDPTMDDGMPRPQDTIMWTPEYMGNGFGYVTSGPAANWNTPFPVANRTRLYRNLTAGVLEGRVPLLPNDLEMGFLYAGGRGLRDLSFYVDPSLEFVHGRVHDWIGGHMGDLENAPADPVFYMYHAYLDCWWDDYRQKQRSLGINPETDYPEDAEAQGVGGTTPLPEWPIPTRVEDSVHLPNKMMRPFRIRNIDGLSDDYTRLYYSCSPRPVCPSCNNSPILFCDNAQNIPKCRTKLQLNTNCTAYKDLNPCHQGECCAIGVGDQYMCRSSCSSFGPVRPIHQLPQQPQVQGPQQTGFDGRLHRGPNDQLPPQYVPNQIPNSVNIPTGSNPAIKRPTSV